MSEDKQVMDMVNEHAARAQFEGRKDTPSVTAQGRASSPKGGAKGGEAAVRQLLVMAIKALLWALLGLTVLAAALAGHAVIVAAGCVCLCVAAAAIQFDRQFRKR